MILKIESSGKLCSHYLRTRVVEWLLETYIWVWKPSEHYWMRGWDVAPNWVNWFRWIAPNRTLTLMRRLYPHNPRMWYLMGYLKIGEVDGGREKWAWEQTPHVDSFWWCWCHRNKDSQTHSSLVHSRFYLCGILVPTQAFSRGYMLEGYTNVPSFDQWR